jgi:glycosyltransferase involved in cell wall biosynthesis
VRVIANGVPDHYGTETGETATTSRRPDDGPIRIGAVSRLSREKGIDILIEAFARIDGRRCEVELVLIGDGSEREPLERLAHDRGVADRVRFMGTRDDVPRLLPTLDIYALPSRSEGLPMAILEAMAASLPMVAARVGGVPEAVIDGETGLLTPPENPAAFAQALQRLIDEPDTRRRMAEAARRRFDGRYDVSCMADGYEAIAREGTP